LIVPKLRLAQWYRFLGLIENYKWLDAASLLRRDFRQPLIPHGIVGGDKAKPSELLADGFVNCLTFLAGILPA